MRDYWTCSKFADWLRGTPKPGALDSKGWKAWKADAAAKHPIRYWIAEEGLDHIQDVVMWIPKQFDSVRYYINNRWITKSHALTAHARDIPPGEWRDVGNRFLPCLFNELVNFVEIEQAWHHCMWSDEAKTKFNVPWYRKGWLRWRTWRCPEAGLEYLRWAAGLKVDEGMGVVKGDDAYGKPTGQAENAREILTLYHWWTVEYPSRPDPYDESGWTAYCEMRRAKGYDFLDFEDKTPEEKEMSQTSHEQLREMEAAYEKEDEEMMIRLIKIRQGLWT
jgi:hypothetical protein